VTKPTEPRVPSAPTVSQPRSQVMRIYITQADNDKHLKQRLPTWRDGFCEIKRRVTFCPDPAGYHAANEYGTISAYGKRVVVVGTQNAGRYDHADGNRVIDW
jgi:hypothetical protein